MWPALGNPCDMPEMLVWQNWLKPGDLFVDVGAHLGFYTLFALDHGAEVIAVEPSSLLAGRIRENLDLNHFAAELIEAGLGECEGTAHLVGPDHSRSHLIQGSSDTITNTVRVTTLDGVLDGRCAAGVKIDVEGAEVLVLRGAVESLRAHRIGLLQLEWNELSETHHSSERSEIRRLLEDFGYEMLRPDGSGTLVPLGDSHTGRDVFARANRSQPSR